MAAWVLLQSFMVAASAAESAASTSTSSLAPAIRDGDGEHGRVLYTPDFAKPLPVGPPPLCSSRATFIGRHCTPGVSVQHWREYCWVAKWRRDPRRLRNPIAELNLFRLIHPTRLPGETPQLPDPGADIDWQPPTDHPRVRYTPQSYFDFFGHTEVHTGMCPRGTYCHPVYNGFALISCRPTVFRWPPPRTTAAAARVKQKGKQLVDGGSTSGQQQATRKRPFDALAGGFLIDPAESSNAAGSSACAGMQPWPTTGRYFTGGSSSSSSSSTSRRQVCRRIDVDEDIPHAALSAMLIDDTQTHLVRPTDGLGMAIAVNDQVVPVCTATEAEAVCEPSTPVDLAAGDTVEFMVDVDVSDLPAVFHFDIDPTKPS